MGTLPNYPAILSDHDCSHARVGMGSKAPGELEGALHVLTLHVLATPVLVLGGSTQKSTSGGAAVDLE